MSVLCNNQLVVHVPLPDLSTIQYLATRMTTQYGQLVEFNPQTDSIKAYFERASLFFTANGVKDDKKVPILLSSIGTPTYSLLSNLFAPNSPGGKSIAEIQKKLSDHFEPARSVITERFHFHKREQAMGETISEYDAALRKLAVHCDFVDKLDDMLHDRFVCGLRHEPIQRCMLSEMSTLTYVKAIEISKAMEIADKSARSFNSEDTSAGITKLGNRPSKSSFTRSQSCYRCGRSNHQPADCKFKDAECHACGKTGHIASACRSKQPKRKKEHYSRKQKGKTHHVTGEDQPSSEGDSSGEEFKLHNVGHSKSDPITVTLELNGKKLEMEVDTGATFSVISEATRQAVFPQETLRPSNLILKTYTNERMEVSGTLNMRVKYGDQEDKLVLIVVAGDGPSLLGRNWLKYIHLDWKSIFTVRSPKLRSLNTLLQQNQELFAEGLGEIHPYTAAVKVQPDATPRFHKARPVPFAIRDTISQELDRLEQEGIITPVTHSKWAAPIVPVPKRDGKFRVCGEYKVTINQALAQEEYPYQTLMKCSQP